MVFRCYSNNTIFSFFKTAENVGLQAQPSHLSLSFCCGLVKFDRKIISENFVRGSIVLLTLTVICSRNQIDMFFPWYLVSLGFRCMYDSSNVVDIEYYCYFFAS